MKPAGLHTHDVGPGSVIGAIAAAQDLAATYIAR